MKKAKIIYLISTGLLSLMMLMSAGMYIVKNADVSVIFSGLGFPTYIIYPLAVAKILGIIAIWAKKSQSLKEWAYAGFFFDFVLAASAHIAVSDGEHIPAIVAIILLFVSYFSERRISASN